ncbi:glycosyltransferase family 2 protein [Burkholderia sp. AU33545]|uniref:glycosyltransferase family 2 protein n=1 Tax=Burkholderia sp. AU33545 TaxID=2879631 RepID=UPI001CF2A526|nr:glycosyltransferase family 2 protein [Burkholderia sp. AU33545]MCA8199753.1 glycosyltransferase family 2 protein [Burkholderia sp. AU33545]
MTVGQPARPGVAAVVVTFNPVLPTLEAQLTSLRPQVSRIVLVDNGSDASALASVAELGRRLDCDMIPLGRNAGIGAAQNRGIEHALARHADYVLLMDHDSVPFECMVDALVEADRALRARGVNVAAVGPVTVDKRNDVEGQFVKLEGWSVKRLACENQDDVVEADFLIASGTLIHAAVLADVGMMKEGMFIDHVDTDWCFRARDRGGRLFGVGRARLSHELGDSARRVWLGRWRHVFVHSPTRDYYVFRNTILMMRGTPMPLAWKLHFLYRLCQFLVFFGLGVSPRLQRLRCMMFGFAHGLVGRTGCKPSDV